MRLDTIKTLCRKRWCAPVMAALYRGKGAKFVSLCHSLDGRQKPVRESLDWLIEVGWVVPNPGYGHPLRPEYVLTPQGEALGPGCDLLWKAMQRANAIEVGLRRWSLPVLATVAALEPARFSGVAGRLDPITNRALSLALGDLSEAGWITRRVETSSWPPATRYLAAPRGSRLVEALAAIRTS